ncbi:hypothetical protein [Sphingomonas sp. DBB INV C78]|uniref:hypothetical protein n=1 Tax=Sphingomonas sp. DBB INV C78 TaxID=3349434 RepID=UPI0036D3F368
MAWIWCCLMLAGAALVEQGGTLGFAVPRNLQLGMIFSAGLILPPLWQRDGMLANAGLPGMSRAMLAILLPIFCGLVGTPFGIDSFVAPPILV